MSGARFIRVSVELPADAVLNEGLVEAMRGLDIRSDGTLRRSPNPYFAGPVVGTWAVIDEPPALPASGH